MFESTSLETFTVSLPAPSETFTPSEEIDTFSPLASETSKPLLEIETEFPSEVTLKPSSENMLPTILKISPMSFGMSKPWDLWLFFKTTYLSVSSTFVPSLSKSLTKPVTSFLSDVESLK